MIVNYVKGIIVIVGIIITVACYLWLKRDTQCGGSFVVLGSIYPTLAWILSMIVLVVCWILLKN